MDEPHPHRGRRRAAAGLGALAVSEVVAAVALSLAVGWSFADMLRVFTATNSTMAVSFAVCGALLGWHRPTNAIGWLFLGAGLAHATTALAAPLFRALHDGGASEVAQRVVLTVGAYAWPWSISLFLPLVLLLFPDGRRLSSRWRPVIVALVATAPLFVVYMGASPAGLDETVPMGGYLTIQDHGALQPLWTLAELRTVLLLGVATGALVLRYRGADDKGRRQLLWLLLATCAVLVFIVPWGFVAGTPVAVLFAIPLIPIAVTVAIVRYQLLDIRLVISRAVAWLLASIVVVVGYVGLVVVLDEVVTAQVGRSAAATVVVALSVAPLLPRLQRRVDRAMYGDRGDPASVLSSIGAELLADPAGGLTGVVSAVRDGLRVPYAAVSTAEPAVDGEPGPDRWTAVGDPAGRTGSVPLEHAGTLVGELVVGLRPGEKTLSDADRTTLALVAVPLAAAVHALRLSSELQASRERIVTAREEERRRLRRDLHDGLGPTLTGIALIADAAANHLGNDPARTRDLLTTLRSNTRTVITEVRRIVENLRPPALDELGLLGALRERAQQVRWRADGETLHIRLDLPDTAPALPAAVEAAGYHIATEALNNIVRHSRATTATLRISYGHTFDMEITDNNPSSAPWRPGVGLSAMRERTAELGGRIETGPSPTGGRVFLSLPLEPAPTPT